MILPILLGMSLFFNLLYLFGIIEFKIGHKPENQFSKFKFIDSPIHHRSLDDLKDKPPLKFPSDSLKPIYFY